MRNKERKPGMTRTLLGKLGALVLMSLGLAGCVDVKIDVALTSMTTAKAVMTQSMDADFYAMVKADTERKVGETGFCKDGATIENADGSADCVMVESGKFADLDLGQEDGAVTFTPAGPGQVRIAIATSALSDAVGGDEQLDLETRKMVDAFLSGRTLTIRFSGAEIVDTNMTLSDDRTHAEETMRLLDLLNGTGKIPETLYAVVRAP